MIQAFSGSSLVSQPSTTGKRMISTFGNPVIRRQVFEILGFSQEAAFGNKRSLLTSEAAQHPCQAASRWLSFTALTGHSFGTRFAALRPVIGDIRRARDVRPFRETHSPLKIVLAPLGLLLKALVARCILFCFSLTFCRDPLTNTWHMSGDRSSNFFTWMITKLF